MTTDDKDSEDSPTTSTEIRSPQDMSWAERKLAEATWRYRVKHMTKSQRRERAEAFLRFRRPLSPEEMWVTSPSINGQDSQQRSRFTTD
jgi:hypothetical protein